MAPTVRFTAFLAVILVLLSRVVTPAPSDAVPVFDVCQESGVCGRGKCVHVSNNTVGFQCDCEPGWRQARIQENQFLSFLPCVIPNCTLNFTCTDASRPRDDDYYRSRTNTSYLDPCSVADCGGGRCNATSAFTRNCVCDEGYYNLLNSTIFPCYRQCAFGQACPSLGFNTSTSIVDPFFPTYNHASSFTKRAENACFITMATTLVRAVMSYI